LKSVAPVTTATLRRSRTRRRGIGSTRRFQVPQIAMLPPNNSGKAKAIDDEVWPAPGVPVM
jgi:hypothetical protein